MRKHDCSFFTVIGHNRIFLNGREFFTGHVISTLGSDSRSAYDLQRHKKEITHVKLVVQNMLN